MINSIFLQESKTVFARHIFPYFLILLLIAVHATALYNDFTYDDYIVIVNKQRQLKKVENIPLLFTRDYFYISEEGSYRPVVTLSYFWDQYLGNGNPFFYHLSNLLLHIANSCLVFYFYLLLCNNYVLSIVSTLFYSTHPVLTEVINGAGFRDDSLVTLFVLMSVIFHIKGRVSLSVASYAISLFSKEAALTVPLLLIFYDLSGHNKTPMLRYSGYALVTAIYLALRFYFLYNPAEATFTTPLSLEDKLVSIPMAILYYLRVILFPTSLSADYAPYSFMTSPTFCSLAFANILFLGTLTLFANKNYHGTVSIFGLFWFFVTLLPVLNLIAIANPFSERYLYLPSVGLIFFLTSLLYEKVTNTKAIVYLAIPVVIFFVVLSIYRNSLWENEETLWSDAMTKAPLSTRSYINLARVSNMNNDYDGAISYLEKALSLNPNSCIAYNSMGVAYLNKGELEDALKRTLQAVKLCPSYTSAYLNLGLIYERLGKIEDAKDSYLKSIEVEPDNPAAHFYLGIIIGSEGRTEQAIKEFMTTLDEDPDFPEAHYNLGWAYELKKDYSSALKEYIAELNINESYHSARFGLIRIYINTGLFEAAELETKRLLEDSQNNAEAQRYLEYVGSIKNKKQGHDRDL